MLYKASAIAIVVVMMLAAAPLFGGLSIAPAAASHDPNAIELASKQVSQDDGESVTIDSVELTAKKSTMRAGGTIFIEIIQDDETLGSTQLSAAQLDTSPSTVEVAINDVQVEGDFEILVEYLGSGVITVSDVKVVEETETSEDEEPDPPAVPDDDDEETDDNDEPQPELENVIATKDIAQGANDTLTVDTVEFTAKKSTLRASGTLTVAIVQDDKVLDSDQISTHTLDTSFRDIESSFDDVEVTDDFQVVFMYDGSSGRVTVNAIEVSGETAPPSEEPNPDPDPSSGTLQLTVNAVDQNNQPIEGLWVTVTHGLSTQGEWTPEVFALEPGTYTVTMDDYFDGETSTMYTFVAWVDSVQDNSRTADLTKDETFTAKFNVAASSQPPSNNPPSNNPPPNNNPPPPSGSGTITAFAHRIPSSFWGPTFVSANAQMYFVLYNSTGYMVYSGFFDENGTTVTGLKNGGTYWIYATNCHHCHGGDHDVAFDHWENNSTENPRSVTPGNSVSAYYEFVPNTP